MEIVFEDPPNISRVGAGRRSEWPQRVAELAKPENRGKWSRWEGGSGKAVRRAAEALGVEVEIRWTTTTRPDGKKKATLYLKVLPPPPPPPPVDYKWDTQRNAFVCTSPECEGDAWDVKRKVESHLQTKHGVDLKSLAAQRRLNDRPEVKV